MDISNLLNNSNLGNIPPEKLNFLLQFANREHGDTAKSMASDLSSAVSDAKKRGITFSDSERDLMIQILKQNMSPQEQQKTDLLLSMMKNMRR